MTWKILVVIFGIVYLLKHGNCEYPARIKDILDLPYYEDNDNEHGGPFIVAEPNNELKLTVTPVSECALYANWTSIENVTEYTISWVPWEETDAQDNAQNHTVGSSTQNYQIEDLIAGTEYTVIVTAFLLDGSYSNSNMRNSTTKDGAPPDVTSLSATETTSTRINIEWVPEPTENDCNPEYHISWSASVNWDPERISEGGYVTYETEYVMSNLIPDSNYSICVVAIATDGAEGAKYCITCLTLEGEPGPPINLIAEALSESEVNVIWNQPPDENGVLGPYTVNWTLLSKAGEDNSTQTNDTSLNIDNLLACGNYSISVHASTEGGVGKPSFTDVITLPEAPPSVTHLDAKNIEARSVEITWRTPDTLCPIKNYTLNGTGIVKWGEKETVLVDDILIEGSPNTYTITELTPFTDYDLLLTPETDGGIGPGAPVTFITLEDVPAAPQNLTIVPGSVKTKSLQITWEAPDITNGILIGFNVTWDNHQQSYPYVSDQKTYKMELTGFKKNTNYNINVTAYTSAGEGSPASIPVKTDNNTAAIVLGILIPCIVIAGLLVAGFIYKDDIRRKMDTMRKT